MQEDRANYGRPREPGDEPEAPVRGHERDYVSDYHASERASERVGGSPMRSSGKSLSPSDERSWSSLAHLSVLINLVTGFGGLVAAPVVWLVYRDRSPKIAFHALQSFWFQAAWAVALTVGWTITGLLMIVLVGFLLLPFMALASLVPFAHGAYAAYKVSQGEDYRYPVIANMLDGGRAKE